MRGFKTILSTTALLAGLAVAPAARAQVMVSIGVPPVCAYGYYDYAPYACSPYGFYGPGYFYNGIFLGMGPWAGWGYGHGWGSHRFVNGGGGRYSGGGGEAAAGGYARGRPEIRGGGASGRQAYAGGSRAPAAHVSQSHSAAPSRGAGNTGMARSNVSHSAPRAAAPHSSGGGGHAGGAPHGGGGGESHGGGKH